MRLFTTILSLLLLTFTVTAQTTILDFEGTAPTLNDFNGSVSTIIDNPDATEPNTSTQVLRNVVPAGAAFAGVNIPQSIDFADGKFFTLQVWSSVPNAPVLLKLEGGTDPATVERAVSFSGAANSWQELTFGFTEEVDQRFTSVTVFMNFNVIGTEELTFYWDNLAQDVTGTVSIAGPDTAAPTPTRDAADVISLFSDAYANVVVDTFRADFGDAIQTDTLLDGNATLLYRNLSFTGIETLGDNAIDLAAAGMTHLHLDFWSANSTAFGIKLVDFGGDGFGNDNDTEFEIQRNLPQLQWASLDYPLSAFTGMNQDDISQLIISSAPGGSSDVYLDNIYFYAGELLGTQMNLPVTFEEEGVDYGVRDFGGAVSAIVADPEDAGNTVVETTKTAGAATFAGTTLTSTSDGPVGFSSPIPLAAGASTMSMRVWSPTAGTPVMIKVENKNDPTISVETLANTTVAGAWETLTFDFSMERTGTAAVDYASVYDLASVFFDFDTSPAADATYYWDDVVFNGVTGEGDAQMDLPVNFEETGIDYGLADFGGNESMIVADPEDESNTVAQSTKTVGAMTWGGTTLTSTSGGPKGFVSAIPFTPEASTMSVRIWSPTAGTPILLKAENADDGTISVETLTSTTVAGAWEVLTFDFTNEAAGTAAINYESVYNTVSIFFNFGTSPTEAATYYWDDIVFGTTVGTDTPVLGLLEVFPNPVNERVTISAPARITDLILYDVNGRIVGRQQPEALSADLDMSGLKPGFYVALANTVDGAMTVKLLKE